MKLKSPTFFIRAFIILTTGIAIGIVFLVVKAEKAIAIGELKWVYGGMKNNGAESSKIIHGDRTIVESSKGISILLDMPYLYVSWFPDRSVVSSYMRIDSRDGSVIATSGGQMSRMCKGRRFLRFWELKKLKTGYTLKQKERIFFCLTIGLSIMVCALLCLYQKTKNHRTPLML